VPQALDGAQPSAGLTTLIATLLFVFPLLVWYRYSEQIASSGGLFAFVEAATGPAIARIQAGFWIFSYFLYLVYTVPFIAYDLVPVVFPQATSYRLLIDVVLVVLVMAVMLSPLIVTLSVTAIIAGSQLVIAVLLAALSLIHLGVPADSFVGHGNLAAVLQGAGRTSSLYVCASLPLFLGGEVRGGGTAIRRALVWAFASVGALAVIAVFPLAHASASIINSSIPGVSLEQAFDGRALVVLVGIGVAASVAGLIIAEFIALSRLLGAVFKRPNRQMVLLISALFLVGSLISLLNPTGAYSLLLKPSLIALWMSQVIVVAVYPWFVRHYRKVQVADAALAAAASAVMLIGLYSAFASSSGT
jgi:amino acid transporter